MGCGSSQPIERQPPPRVHDNAGSSVSGGHSSNPQRALHERTNQYMSPAIQTEFMNAVDRAFGSTRYGIIGGAALTAYGSPRGTSDIDVIVPDDVSDIIEGHLLHNGMVRTARGGIGYVASDGRCYGLDITAARNIGQRFNSSQTRTTPQSRGRIMAMPFLLDSKAYSYLTRVGPNKDLKIANDARDIFFIIEQLRRNNVQLNSRDFRWIVDYDFWNEFCQAFPQAEHLLRSLGLQREPTPNSSNRATRRSSQQNSRSH